MQLNYKNKLIIVASLIICALLVIIYKEENHGHWMQHYYQRHFASQEDFTQKSRKFDYWCIQGWTNTLQKLNIDCDICFFGHSQIVPIDYQENYPDMKFVTLGYWGDDVDGMLHRVGQVKCVKPEKVFFMCGINSIWYSDTVFIKKYNAIVDSMYRALPTMKLYVMNILPECDGMIGHSSMNERIRQRNICISDYCSRKNITLIDLYSLMSDEDGNLKREVSLDGLHINETGYEILRQELDKYITEIISAR